jgi:glucan-binding YG repeat protein
MLTIRIAILITSLFFAGCDRGKEVGELKGDAASNKQQIASLQVELALVKNRLSALESEFAQNNIDAMQKKILSDNGHQPLTESQIVMLKKTISQCVQFVKSSAPNNEVYSKFDAFYNPASGRVQNNNQYVDQSSIYAFNKCMTEQGFPLS